MPVELKVPQSGESITEVQIGQWRKSVGDYVKVDEVLVEIETDKAAIELPSPIAGILTKIIKNNGDEAAVGDVIGLMEEASAPAGAAAKPAAELAAAAKDETPASATRATPAPKSAPGDPRVMPAGQRVLSQSGIEAASVEGTGPGGRITKDDAQQAATTPTPEPAPVPKAAPPKPLAPPVAVSSPGREEEVVPMTPMRKVIAKNLVSAQQTAALLTTFNEVDMSTVMDLRKRWKEPFLDKFGVKLGFMSFFVKGVVEALKECPGVNARVEGTHIVYRKYFDVGIAVGGGRGLVVPILRNAENMSFAEIESTIGDFARRAQANKIDLSELQGGTFTISNGGIYGSMLSTPIVNPPQSGILGLHAIQDRAVVEKGEVVVRPMMYVALTYDHRVVDGREAVTFLKRIKDVIENPERIFLEV
jgi:2-oxoglutarate dehydrogenase E2 component (dihydrolipoamide succinyltransferase)